MDFHLTENALILSSQKLNQTERNRTMSAMAFNLQASTTTRGNEADINKQLSAIFNDFSKALAAVIAANSFFITNQTVMTCLVAMIVVYFLLVLVLGTLLQPYITDHLFFTILSGIMLLIGSAVSVLALILIEPIIAFIIAILWIGVFVLVAIVHRGELCEFMSCVTGKVKNLIGTENQRSPRPEV